MATRYFVNPASFVGFANPMTTMGDLIRGGAAGAAQRLPAAVAGQVLVSGSTPNWGALPAGATPLINKGDILVFDGTNLQNLTAGSNGQALFADSTAAFGLSYKNPTSTVTEAIATKTANYTLTATDAVIIANAATLTMTLPSAVTAGAGRTYTIKNGPSGTSTTVSATAGTIDGSASDTTLTMAFSAARYISDGTNWFKI